LGRRGSEEWKEMTGKEKEGYLKIRTCTKKKEIQKAIIAK